MRCLPLGDYDGLVALCVGSVVVGAEKELRRIGAEKVSNVIVASVGRLIKPSRRAPALKLAPPPRRRRSSGADTNPGWLSRHSSRSFHGTKPYEPYVDLSVLELTRRH